MGTFTNDVTLIGGKGVHQNVTEVIVYMEIGLVLGIFA